LSIFSGFSKSPSWLTFLINGLIMVQLPISINIVLPISFDRLPGIFLSIILLKDMDKTVPTIDIKDIIKLLIYPIFIFFIPYDRPTTKLSVLAEIANKSEDNIFIDKALYISCIHLILFKSGCLCH